jgi:serine/threonine protein kinase
MDLDEVRTMVLQLVSGLDYLHRNGVVHRDLSPANLLLTAKRRIKIADFGLASLQVTGIQLYTSRQPLALCRDHGPALDSITS